MLILKRPWDSQPQEAVEIDWNNPITRGLASALINGVDVVTGRPTGFVQVGASQRGATERGELPYDAATDLADVTLIGHHRYTSDNGDYAGHVYGYYVNTTNSSQLGIGFGVISAGAPDIYAIHRDNGGGSTNVEANPSLPYDAILAITGTLGSSAAATTYKNGAVLASVARSGPGSFATDTRRTHQKMTATSTGKESAWAYRFTRILSAEEIRALSGDPWQIFSPRRIYIPGAVVGGGGTTITCGVAAASAPGVTALLNTTTQASVAAAAAAGVTALLNTSVNATPGEASATGVGAGIALAGSTSITTSPGAAAAAGVSTHVDLTLNATPAEAAATGVSALLPLAIGTTPAEATADGLTTQLQRIFGVQVADAIAAGVQALVNNASATVGRPASDTSNTGWTASTGSDLYAMLDEVAPDAADYIVATSAGAVCELTLNATGYPGTSSQVLKFRASSSTGNSVIVRLKNTGGTTVRSATQLLTSTDTEYGITLTAGEIAAITSGDLSVQLESA